MTVEHISVLAFIYAAPISYGIFCLSGAWLYFKTKLLASITLLLGASLPLIDQIKQIFFPFHLASYTEDGEVIYKYGPTIIDHLFLIMSSMGMLVCAVSFLALAINMAAMKNGT